MENISQSMDSLNAEQRQAAMHLHGPQLVLAGAGTGKTRVITTRIAYLISLGIAPESILAVSFTRKAGLEMKERLLEIVGEQANLTHVSTFHSLGLSILREHFSAARLRQDFRVCDDKQQAEFFEEVFEHLEPSLLQGITMADDTELKRGVLNTKSLGLGPESLLAAGDDYSAVLAEALIEYDKLLRQNNLIDMDDMVTLPTQLLEANAEVRRFYQNRFRFMMVDEYQDTNEIQHRLVSSLLGVGKHLCVVGDDDQSIYTFRGANRDLILNFPKQYPGAKVVKLTANYRCSSQIIEVANAVINGCKNRHSKTLVSAIGPSSPVRFIDLETAYTEQQYIADELKQSPRPYSDVAILCRSKRDVREMKFTLQRNELPVNGKRKGVNVMTLHASKGLEFPAVYLTGVQESNLPHWNAIKAGPEAIEEERRLFYVGVTRAKEQLTLSAIQSRNEYSCDRSRFAEELLELVNVKHHSLAS